VESGPTDAERMRYPKLASLNGGEAEEAFRTEPESPDAMEVTHAMGRMLDAQPAPTRTRGGAVLIPPLIRGLNVPA
jgi:hypothetical protein